MGNSGGSTEDRMVKVASAMAAFRDSWKSAPSATEQQMQLQVKAAAAENRRRQKLHRRKERRLRRRAIWGGSLAVLGVLAALVDIAVAPIGVWFVAGGVTAATAGWLALDARRQATQLSPPALVAAPPPPPAPLPAGTVGAQETAELHRVRVQLSRMLPSIESISPQAAQELRRTDLEAAPAMSALVARLDTLSSVQTEMAGTPVAQQAAVSAAKVQNQLRSGVDHYTQLLSSALELMSAPEPQLSFAKLHATSAELLAHAEGVRTMALTDPDPER